MTSITGLIKREKNDRGKSILMRTKRLKNSIKGRLGQTSGQCVLTSRKSCQSLIPLKTTLPSSLVTDLEITTLRTEFNSGIMNFNGNAIKLLAQKMLMTVRNFQTSKSKNWFKIQMLAKTKEKRNVSSLPTTIIFPGKHQKINIENETILSKNEL